MPEFLPHTDSCSECGYGYPTYHSSTLLETKNEELVFHTEVTRVPKLSLLAAGVYSSEKLKDDMWKHVTVRNCIDLKRDMKSVATSKMLTHSQFWMRLLTRRILPLTTKEAFLYKTSALSKLVEGMQSENALCSPSEKKATKEKFKHIINLSYADCDPWMRSKSKRKGIIHLTLLL